MSTTVPSPADALSTATANVSNSILDSNSLQAVPAVHYTTNTSPSTGRLFTEEEVNRFRQQMHDQLYGQIESTKARADEHATALKDLQGRLESIQAEKEAALQAERDRAEAARQEALTAKELIAESNNRWESQIAQLRQEQEAERALALKERRYHELTAYKNARLAEETQSGSVAPQFHAFVTGNTEQEIDAAIEAAKQATQSIFEEVSQSRTGRASTGVGTTGYGPIGPMDTAPTTRNLSAQDIDNIPMSQWGEARKSFGVPNTSGRGIFG